MKNDDETALGIPHIRALLPKNMSVKGAVKLSRLLICMPRSFHQRRNMKQKRDGLVEREWMSVSIRGARDESDERSDLGRQMQLEYQTRSYYKANKNPAIDNLLSF